ncbi:MAG: DnaJ C-terminal domain-containing protein [Pyrinomonadaceae bacterium]
MADKTNRGADLSYDLEITLEEAATGHETLIEFSRPLNCKQCDGNGHVSAIHKFPKSKCQACVGKGQIMQETKIEVKIPAGVETGSRLRINGMGEGGSHRETGDFFIVLHIAEHEFFERQGANLYRGVFATSEQLINGAEIDIPTLIDGKQILKLPPMTETGTVFRIKGKGMPILASKERGDLFVAVTWSASVFVQSNKDVNMKNKQDESKPKLRVFLCHSSNDKPAVRTLYHRLIADGIIPWLDEEDLLPGQRWETEIPKAVRNSDIVVVCLSQGSINKQGYLQREIRYALDAAQEQPEDIIYLIPLKFEECEIPEHLRGWQWVNFFEERGYERLMMALRRRENCL